LDLDGTLADSIGPLFQVYEQFLARVGREGAGSRAEFNELNGPRIDEVVARLRLTHHLGDSSADVLSSLYRKLLAKGMLAVRPAPGAAELLLAARRSGWATCVVTSGRSDEARRWLAGAGLDSLLDHVVGGEMVRKGKPDPESYRTALTLCDAEPAASIAVEDSVAGAEAAIAAGVRTFFMVAESDAGQRLAPPGTAGTVSHLQDVECELEP
jgi:HAD superfamily hydrolase (TIGR01509 family)